MTVTLEQAQDQLHKKNVIEACNIIDDFDEGILNSFNGGEIVLFADRLLSEGIVAYITAAYENAGWKVVAETYDAFIGDEYDDNMYEKRTRFRISPAQKKGSE